MSAYRENVTPQARLAQRAPWWRLLRASVDGTLLRLSARRTYQTWGTPYWGREVF